MRIPDYTVSQFGGLNTFIKDTKTLKPGIATDAKNWITSKYGDHIELRRGTALLGQTRQGGAGKITGLGVGIKNDGTQIPFWTRARKIEYYDAATDDRIEVKDRLGNGDLLYVAADGEDSWFAPYENLAGSHIYVGSPHTSIWKIPVANPGTAVDQLVNSFRFGFLSIGQGRSFAGRRYGTTAGNQDLTGQYLSDIDHALLSAYTQVTGEAYGTGDAVTKTFAHTLSGVAGTIETVMYVSVTDGVETFSDDRNGSMVGNLGGTGTVNYASGAVSVTFATAPLTLAAITCSFYFEAATTNGVLDFDTSTPGAGQAKIFRQDDGGAFIASFPFLDTSYCLHLFKTWALKLSLTDTDSTNLPYRTIGVPYQRAAYPTADGILIVDTSNPSDPKVRRLELGQNSANVTVIPSPLSDALDLSSYGLNTAVTYRWGDFEIVCLQEYLNGVAVGFNSVMLIRNVFSGAWDRLDYKASCLATLAGALIAGDPISANVFTLFSGFDDDGSVIDNYWQDGQLNLGTEHLKVAHLMRVTGLIMKDQNVKVSLVLDDGTAVEVGGTDDADGTHHYAIEGDGSYVDQGINTTIGSVTIGSKVIGGGGEATAHPFDVTFEIHTDRFQHISVRFEAQDIGYAAINSYTYKDVRDKGARSLPTKTVS